MIFNLGHERIQEGVDPHFHLGLAFCNPRVLKGEGLNYRDLGGRYSGVEWNRVHNYLRGHRFRDIGEPRRWSRIFPGDKDALHEDGFKSRVF